ncbi:DDB1- and CUL4-associated factor 6-like [Sipha flava]|uniref:DDB1- and CUL4-associated factor 6-like n=1 Tax=Sipha flava TaxID=143950 RepID=A0A8B8FUT6_9HEMI|nr:DDB1- and CUL4-associated factor 6-like [Sipha flava]
MFPTKGLFRNVFFQPYNDQNNVGIRVAAKDNKHLVQRLTLEQTVKQRRCVNSLQWNDTGNLLLSAGDDRRIVIINPFTHKNVVDYKTRHQTNIFCAKFLPTMDNRIISCGADGSILNLDLERQKETEWNFFTCHETPCYEIETIPGDPNTFLSCSEDGTVRLYDLRASNLCSRYKCRDHILINCDTPVSTIAVNPKNPYELAIATLDSTVRVVDRRKIILQDPTDKIVPECAFTVPHLSHRSYRITSLSYSSDGRNILANYSDEDIYMFSTDKDPNITAVANDYLENPPYPPPYRRIRLRGDWTDTGPLSEPSVDTERDRIQSIVMGQMSDILVQILNTPSLRSAIMHNWRPLYSRLTRQTLDSVQINGPNNENSNLDANNVEPSTSTDSGQETEKRKKLKLNERCPGFNDFVPLQPVKAQYKGHRNSRTLIKEASFWGNDFIISGSDCGHVFIWDRYTCEIVMLLRGDNHVVNCIQPHPSLPLLATSGVDHDVKLWSPRLPDIGFSQEMANELVEKNKLMMEQSRDTITVSPTLIVRMLNRFNILRQAEVLIELNEMRRNT